MNNTALRDALESIFECVSEERHLRSDSSRLYEIRTYASVALASPPAQAEPAGLEKAFAEYLYRTASQVPFEHHEWARQQGAALLEQLKANSEPTSSAALNAAYEAGRQRGMNAPAKAELVALLRSALNGMLTQFGMDEDEWNKPTFDAARRALDATSAAPAQAQPDPETLHRLAQEVRAIAAQGSTPDGDDVNTPTLLWAEEWGRRLAEPAHAAQAKPEPAASLRAAFAKIYPNDDAILELSEHDRDFNVEAIGARHHWSAFQHGARAAAQAAQAEPTAWLLRPKVPHHPGRSVMRGCYTVKPTNEQVEMAALDGDEYLPLYIAAPAPTQVAQRNDTPALSDEGSSEPDPAADASLSWDDKTVTGSQASIDSVSEALQSHGEIGKLRSRLRELESKARRARSTLTSSQ